MARWCITHPEQILLGQGTCLTLLSSVSLRLNSQSWLLPGYHYKPTLGPAWYIYGMLRIVFFFFSYRGVLTPLAPAPGPWKIPEQWFCSQVSSPMNDRGLTKTPGHVLGHSGGQDVWKLPQVSLPKRNFVSSPSFSTLVGASLFSFFVSRIPWEPR